MRLAGRGAKSGGRQNHVPGSGLAPEDGQDKAPPFGRAPAARSRDDGSG